VIKTADGRYFVSEEGSGESTAWIETDYILGDLHWRNLLMTDTPTNASNRRAPDPKRVPIVATSKAVPDLSRVDEVGFSDLMPGGWIPATSRVNAFLAILLCCWSGRPWAQRDWVYYGQDPGGTKYSTLDQINTTNVAKLERAWTVHTGDTGGFFSSSPLVIDNIRPAVCGRCRPTPGGNCGNMPRAGPPGAASRTGPATPGIRRASW
jgi:hypothetical protein